MQHVSGRVTRGLQYSIPLRHRVTSQGGFPTLVCLLITLEQTSQPSEELEINIGSQNGTLWLAINSGLRMCATRHAWDASSGITGRHPARDRRTLSNAAQPLVNQ